MGVLDRSFCPVLFPHRLPGCLLRSGGNIVSRVLRAPLPRGLRMSSPEHASPLTLDSLQSTSLFAITDIIIPVYKHRVGSPVYKLWPPERALVVSPLDLFNLHLEPLHSSKFHPSYWVSAATPDQNPGIKSVGPGGGGPRFDDPLIGAFVHPESEAREPGPGLAPGMLARSDPLMGPTLPGGTLSP